MLSPVPSWQASASRYGEDVRLTKNFPAMQLQQGSHSRGCRHSVMFRLPCLLDPPIAPTAAALFVRTAAGPFTPRNEPGITPRSCGIATCLIRAIGTVGLSPTGLWPCRPLPLRHMPLSILHTHDFGQSLEFLFEAPIGREPEVEHGGPGWLEDVGRVRRQLALAQCQLARRGRWSFRSELPPLDTGRAGRLRIDGSNTGLGSIRTRYNVLL